MARVCSESRRWKRHTAAPSSSVTGSAVQTEVRANPCFTRGPSIDQDPTGWRTISELGEDERNASADGKHIRRVAQRREIEHFLSRWEFPGDDRCAPQIHRHSRSRRVLKSNDFDHWEFSATNRGDGKVHCEFFSMSLRMLGGARGKE